MEGLVHISPDERWAVFATGDQALLVWDLRAGRARHRLAGHAPRLVSGGVCSPDGRYLVSRGLDHTTRVWDIDAGRLVLAREVSSETTPAFMADSRRAVSIVSDRHLTVWELETGREVAMISLAEPWLRLALSHAGREVVGLDAAGGVHCVELPGAG
jgi:WD40 repeat protein